MFASNVIRGIWLLARGRAAGLKEFGDSLEAFHASLAPLIAFPLVLSLLMAAQSPAWQSGTQAKVTQLLTASLAFVSQLCVVLTLPVLTQVFAQITKRTPLWMRTATALNWSFWICIPLFLIAGLIGAAMVAAGVPQAAAEIGLTIAVGLYILWYHWFTVRVGLGLGVWAAILLVVITNLAISLLSAGPELIDFVITGHLPAAWTFL